MEFLSQGCTDKLLKSSLDILIEFHDMNERLLKAMLLKRLDNPLLQSIAFCHYKEQI